MAAMSSPAFGKSFADAFRIIVIDYNGFSSETGGNTSAVGVA
jgi:hypothetical protein